MSNTYTREEISAAVNDGADLIYTEFDLGDRDYDLLGLVVNSIMTRLESPEADLNQVAEECYSESLDEIRTW